MNQPFDHAFPIAIDPTHGGSVSSTSPLTPSSAGSGRPSVINGRSVKHCRTACIPCKKASKKCTNAKFLEQCDRCAEHSKECKWPTKLDGRVAPTRAHVKRYEERITTLTTAYSGLLHKIIEIDGRLTSSGQPSIMQEIHAFHATSGVDAAWAVDSVSDSSPSSQSGHQPSLPSAVGYSPGEQDFSYFPDLYHNDDDNTSVSSYDLSRSGASSPSGICTRFSELNINNGPPINHQHRHSLSDTSMTLCVPPMTGRNRSNSASAAVTGSSAAISSTNRLYRPRSTNYLNQSAVPPNIGVVPSFGSGFPPQPESHCVDPSQLTLQPATSPLPQAATNFDSTTYAATAYSQTQGTQPFLQDTQYLAQHQHNQLPIASGSLQGGQDAWADWSFNNGAYIPVPQDQQQPGSFYTAPMQPPNLMITPAGDSPPLTYATTY
ncbi:hypothetical protein BKA62DRAFT_714206 [Auriculariales sp. MPI-PUGE-AT-0066]|nr:hypothetical protein BKA62DRAFT_714206 [Auriculariales sp. MPI-PUGE-AT-0066]